MIRASVRLPEMSDSMPATGKTHRPGQRPFLTWTQSAIVVAALVGCFAVAMNIGSATASRSAHVAGACIALDMAEAHGAMDEPRRKRVLYSLVNAASPYAGRFTMTLSEMLRTCADLRISASPRGN